MEQQIAIQTSKLCKIFDRNQVLNNLEITVTQGEIYGILGANGAGKTTLLKLIAGLLEPTEGTALVFSKSPWEQRQDVLQGIGTLIETPIFYEHLSAQENLCIHLSYMSINADVQKALERVGLSTVGNKPVSKFSLGMRQRLAIARSIIHEPKVLLLDEPINGLDPVAIREMRELLISLKNDGVTILLSSHILSEVLQTVERVAIITKGNLVEQADMNELKDIHGKNLEDYFLSRLNGGVA